MLRPLLLGQSAGAMVPPEQLSSRKPRDAAVAVLLPEWPFAARAAVRQHTSRSRIYRSAPSESFWIQVNMGLFVWRCLPAWLRSYCAFEAPSNMPPAPSPFGGVCLRYNSTLCSACLRVPYFGIRAAELPAQCRHSVRGRVNGMRAHRQWRHGHAPAGGREAGGKARRS